LFGNDVIASLQHLSLQWRSVSKILSALSQEIGWEERRQNDLFLHQMSHKNINSVIQSKIIWMFDSPWVV